MPNDDLNKFERNICIHIFSVSAAMVGVCLTVIGLIRIVVAASFIMTLADDFLAMDALLFLIACLFAYSALRCQKTIKMYRLERIADYLFISALILMVAACAIIAYELI
jgi:hypothetical protein